MLGVMVGRRSIFPMLEPDSRFVDGLRYANPNYVLWHHGAAVEADDKAFTRFVVEEIAATPHHH